MFSRAHYIQVDINRLGGEGAGVLQSSEFGELWGKQTGLLRTLIHSLWMSKMEYNVQGGAFFGSKCFMEDAWAHISTSPF